ncbi:MAG: hypothetical protein ACRD2T_02055 [Thermoanaerobaculia bacterium]
MDGSCSARRFTQALVLAGLSLALAGTAPAGAGAPPAELFAVQIRWGNGFLEFPFGSLDPVLLEFQQAGSFIYRGRSILDAVSAFDPSAGMFYLLGDGTLVAVDTQMGAGEELPLTGLPRQWMVNAIERDPVTGSLFGTALVPDGVSGARLLRIDPGSGNAALIGEAVVPGGIQGNLAVDWAENRLFVPGFEENHIRLSVLDLGRGAVIGDARVELGSWNLRSIEWDPRDRVLLGLITTDFRTGTIARIDPETGEVFPVAEVKGAPLGLGGDSVLDADSRRLYFRADLRVWAADVDTGAVLGSSSDFQPVALFSIAINRLSGPEAKVGRFRRGDANADLIVGIEDAIWILAGLFLGGPAQPCARAGDADDDGAVTVTDAVYLLWHLFLRGPQPPYPFLRCGEDLTPDGLDCLTAPTCR